MPPIVKQGRKLVDAVTGSTINVGAVRESGRGERYVVSGGEPPRHSASTGRVWCYLESEYGQPRATEYEFFPGVLDLKWVEA